jgi:CheY-like chemotaxis protein
MNDARGRRILIVDFDEVFLIQGQILLEDCGFDVTTTWNGMRAAGLLSSQRFDLVLLSDYLPDIGTRGLWSLLRRVPSGTEVAVVQSAHPTIPEICDLLRDHAQHCTLPRGTPRQITDQVIQCLGQPRKAQRTIRTEAPEHRIERDSVRSELEPERIERGKRRKFRPCPMRLGTSWAQ